MTDALPPQPEDPQGSRTTGEPLSRSELYDTAKFEFEVKRQAAERAHDRSNEWGAKLAEAATRDAQEAMKVALVINGGAAIAVLAFIGSLGSKSGIPLGELRSVIRSLFWFAGGVLSSGITAACAYFANSFYAGSHFTTEKIWEHPYIKDTRKSRRRDCWGRGFNIAGIIIAVVALVLFVVGVYAAARGMSRLVSLRLGN